MVAWAYRYVEPKVQSLDVVVAGVDAPSLTGSEELGGRSIFEDLELTPYCVEADEPDPFERKKSAPKGTPNGTPIAAGKLAASDSRSSSFGFATCCLKPAPSKSDLAAVDSVEGVESADANFAPPSKPTARDGIVAVPPLNLAVGVVVRGRDFQASPRSGNLPSPADAHAVFSILRTDGSPGAVAVPLSELVRRCRVCWHPLSENGRPKGQDLARAFSDLADFWKDRETKPLGAALNPKADGNASPPAFSSPETWRPFLGPAGGAKVVFTSDLARLATRFVAGGSKLPGKAVVADLDQVRRTSSALKPVLSPSSAPEAEAPGVLKSDVSLLTPTFYPAVPRKRPLAETVVRSGSCPSLDSLKRLCALSNGREEPRVSEACARQTHPEEEEDEEEEIEFPLARASVERSREPSCPQFLDGSHWE